MISIYYNINKIREAENPNRRKDYEMVHFDDIWGIALVACKPVSTVIYKIVIPADSKLINEA